MISGKSKLVPLLAALLVLGCLSACGGAEAPAAEPENASGSLFAGTAAEGPAVTESVPTPPPDYEAVDAFLNACLADLEGGAYTLQAEEGFPGCGESFMFVIVDNTRTAPSFVRSIPETVAYIPEVLGESRLCWDPEACDTVFYLYSEASTHGTRYDNGTYGYDMYTMLTVLYPKEGRAWGPVRAHNEWAPNKVTGGGVGYDTYARFNYEEGLCYVYSLTDIELPTYIRMQFYQDEYFAFTVDRYVLADPGLRARYGLDAYSSMSPEEQCVLLGIPEDEVKSMSAGEIREILAFNREELWRRTQWQDLDGMVLRGPEGATLTIHADEGHEIVSASMVSELDSCELYPGNFMDQVHRTDDIDFGRKYDSYMWN